MTAPQHWTCYPPRHQPERPANDNKPEPSLQLKLLMAIGVAACILMILGAIAGGLLSMTGTPK